MTIRSRCAGTAVRDRRHAERGLTFLEVTITLTATTALVAALLPTLATVVTDTKRVRATQDATNIKTAILAFLSDTGLKYFTVDGTSVGTQVELLVGDGDIPREVSHTRGAPWNLQVTNEVKDFLGRHLVTNDPGGNAANAYPSSGGGKLWRGAYLTGPIDPDPWGNRYAVNVEWLGTPSEDCIVFSSGPDEVIDTADGDAIATAGGDDIIIVVEG